MDQVKSFLNERPDGFLIVGIGASAGGVQALQDFFRNVPADAGIAWVVILHLSPDHDSQLTQVLEAETSLPVIKVAAKVKIEPDHVYVVPPNQHLVMEDGNIVPLANMKTEDRRAPVDIFFRHLADTQGPRAVSVILSGTGANGSMGLKRVKEMGGVVFVQNPREAEFNEMPRNSIATELVDEVLPVALMPSAIINYRNNIGAVQINPEAENRPEQEQQALRAIFTQLKVRTGHDFTNYKRPTLLRRIERRINVRNLPDLPAYSGVLQKDPDESTALLKDLLISVTNFFRDKKAFATLEQDIIPAILKGKKGGDQVRVWVAGCATGEEAYSIAMLFAERILNAVDAPAVQIFATDIHEGAIAVARQGYYTLNDAADVSPDRLRRFFIKEGDGYRVRRELREMILFAAHNFLKDPPFSRLDMVTCRNVLIYLNNIAQERVMETFHFALRPGGYLFLGTSESVDGASDLYATVSREHHIFRAREATSRHYPVPESAPKHPFPATAQPAPPEKESRPPTRNSFAELHQKLLEEYAPPSVVINEEYEIVHLSETVGKYFEFKAGEPTQNLLKLVRPEIRLELRTALYQAVQKRTAVESRGLKVAVNGEVHAINLHIRPVLATASTSWGFILVIFEPAEKVPDESPVVVSSDEPVAKQLEEELTRLKTQLRASNEEHEFQAEELKVANEELQAMNEELRSSAEELETSKEELQSINEELRAVNQELKVKIEETSSTSDNLQNLINSVDIGAIFLDRGFRIRMFTPAVLDIFNLIPSDHGRPISDITNKLDYPDLIKDAETVLQKLTVVEREVQTSDNSHFLMRVLPYRTTEDRINGVVVTFFSINRSKRAELALRQSEERLRLLIKSASDYAIMTLDGERKVTAWSSGAAAMLGYTEQEMIGQSGDIMFIPEDREKGAPEDEARTAAEKGRAENERWHLRKRGSRFWASGVTSPLRDGDGKVVGFVKIMQDLTERKGLEVSKFFLASIVETSTDSIVTIDLDRKITSWNKAAEHLYGYPAAEAIGKNLTMLTRDQDFQLIVDMVDDIIHRREVKVFDTIRTNKDGRQLDLEIVMSPVQNRSGEIIGVSTIARDVSARKQVEETLRIAAERDAFAIELSNALQPLTDPVEVQSVAMRVVGEWMKVDRVLYGEIHGDDVTIVDNYVRGGAHKIVGKFSTQLFGTAREIQLRGNNFVVNDIPNDERLPGAEKEAMTGLGFQACLAVPLFRNERWVGNFAIYHDQPHAWTAHEIHMVEDAADRIWIAIERAKAEQNLRENEEKFRKVSNAVPQLIWSNDVEGKANYFNQRWYDFTELSYEESYGVGWMAIVHPDDALASIEKWKKSLANGEIFSTEYRLRNAKGSYCWFVGRNVPLKDEGGKVTGWFGSATDIHDLKNAEEALRQSKEQLRLIIESAKGFAILTTDTEGIINSWSPGAAEVFGWSGEEIIGKGGDVLFTPEDRANHQHQREMETAARNGIAPDIRWHLHKSGSLVFIHGVSHPVYDASGKLNGFVKIGRDITAQHNAETALRETEENYRVQLEKEVEQRTAELKEMNTNLRYANENLQQFASIASHDLQEPLRKMKMFASLLNKHWSKELPDKGKEVVRKITLASDRMGQLIREVLEYSKIAYSTKEFQPTDLHGVLQNVLGDLDLLLEETGTVVEYKSNLPVIEAIPLQIHQLFYNLVNNAVKFRKEGVPSRIRISAAPLSPDEVAGLPHLALNEDYITISFSDDGIGFDQQFAEQIFQIFERLHTTDEYEGTGVGLALCKKIVENHRGHIIATSRDGGGAQFRVVLPVAQ